MFCSSTCNIKFGPRLIFDYFSLCSNKWYYRTHRNNYNTIICCAFGVSVICNIAIVSKWNTGVFLISKNCGCIVATVCLHIFLCDDVYPRVFRILNTIGIIRWFNHSIRVGMYTIDVIAYLLIKPASSILIGNRA